MAGQGAGPGAGAVGRPLSLRAIAPSAFMPALVYEIGNGAIAPVIALTALAEGASTHTAALMVALLGVGQVLGDLPAGALADRLGDRRAMVVAAGVALAAFACIAAVHRVWLLAPALTVVGMANATYYLGRISYLTEVVPPRLRARAMSTMAGSHRIGLFLGPFVGALAIHVGGLRAPYLVAVATTGSAAMLLWAVPDVAPQESQRDTARGDIGSWQMLRTHRRLFATLGAGVFLVGAIRAARQTVLPLWANHLGLSPGRTSLVFGIASAVDVAMFYPSGQVMDKFGRLAIALPCAAVLGVTMLALPLTSSTLALTLVAMVMSMGNGIGAGIMMTLGADTAPRESRSRFLAMWRLMGDSGNAAGPLVVAAVSVVAGLAGGIMAIGVVGLVAVGVLARTVPRYSPYATPRAMRRHRRRS